MSRVIKFRAWADYGSNGEMLPNIQNHINGDWAFGNILMNNVKGTKFSVMQYTGLKDKNGVEIYEGDIIPYYGKNYQVVMVGACWTLDEYEEMDYYNDDAPKKQDWSTFEVVGNIHQHSHLLDSN